MSLRLLLPIMLALVLGFAAPWAFMRMLVPSLAEGRRVTNYRGREVYYGLGAVWLVWAGTAIVAGIASSSLGGKSLMVIMTLAGPLALVGFAVGLLDDAYGTGADRGFRGHIRAAKSGRLTTGGIKLLGVSAASLVVALIVSGVSGWSQASMLPRLLASLAAGAAIALTANFVNLTDLRPGRALKVYVLLAVLGCVSVVLGMQAPGVVEARRASDLVALLIFTLGPVLAVWRYDLGEQGMLGDSGANAMGAVAGMLIVIGLPLWLLLGYLALMLGLNLASERLSFSRVIEGNAVLKRLDMLGRSGEVE